MRDVVRTPAALAFGSGHKVGETIKRLPASTIGDDVEEKEGKAVRFCSFLLLNNDNNDDVQVLKDLFPVSAACFSMDLCRPI
jgi:hypothetical protein